MGEEKCLVSQCCCGCTLRTGALVIGILYLIGYLGWTCTAIAGAVAGVHVLWFTAVIFFIEFVASCLLIHGTRFDRADLVKVWVFTTMVCSCLKLIGLIISAVNGVQIVQIVGMAIGIALDVYFIIVVRSFAKELESGPAASPA